MHLYKHINTQVCNCIFNELVCITEGTRLTITTSTTLLVIDNVYLLGILQFCFVLLFAKINYNFNSVFHLFL